MRLFASAVSGSCLLLAVSIASADDIGWQRIKIEDAFQSEGVAAADVNKDGKMDVINGMAWYEAPNWTKHPIREPKDYKDGSAGYSNSFANWAYDLNGDGWDDLICIDFPGIPCYWFENPKGKEGFWKQHPIWHSAANETPLFTDVTGDGKPELVMSSETEGIYGYLEIPSIDMLDKEWAFTAVSTEKLGAEKVPNGTHRYYHGLGVGDVNKDGRSDIIIPHGWWEQPTKEQLGKGPWTFHPLALHAEGKTDYMPAADIYVDDIDLDGDNDILLSSAHNVGIWWFENLGPIEDPKFRYHLISDIVTQTHALHFVDINGDGTKDLVTGKRWWAHGPKGDVDPGAVPVVVWFEIRKQKGEAGRFTPHVIAESAESGIGTQFFVGDINGDKHPDIVLSNKKGTNVLLQRRAAKTASK